MNDNHIRAAPKYATENYYSNKPERYRVDVDNNSDCESPDYKIYVNEVEDNLMDFSAHEFK